MKLTEVDKESPTRGDERLTRLLCGRCREAYCDGDRVGGQGKVLFCMARNWSRVEPEPKVRINTLNTIAPAMERDRAGGARGESSKTVAPM